MAEKTQITPELQQQIGVLNARITNVNLANADLIREVDSAFKALVTTISALQKENADLKTKLQETPKTQ